MATQQNTSPPAVHPQFLRDLGDELRREQRRIAADLRAILTERRRMREVIRTVLESEPGAAC